METETHMQSVIAPGQLYEDDFFHPCLCTHVEDGIAYGISLIDGSYPRGCDTVVGGMRILTPSEALHVRLHGPVDPADRERLASQAKWWG